MEGALIDGPALPRAPPGFKPPAADALPCYEPPTRMAEPTASMDVPAREPQSQRAGPPAPAARLGAKSEKSALERDLSRVDGGKWLRRLGILAAIAALIGAGVLWRVKHQPKPPPKYVTAVTSKGDVFETVQSTGQVQPLTQVQVGAQVSGRVTKVFVDFNSLVKQGDILAEIDPTLFSAAIDQTRAVLDSAQASVVHADAALITARQRLD